MIDHDIKVYMEYWENRCRNPHEYYSAVNVYTWYDGETCLLCGKSPSDEIHTETEKQAGKHLRIIK